MANSKTNYIDLITPALVIAALAAVPSNGCSVPRSSGVQYSVGDSLWTIPPFPYYYSNWSSSHFFKTGDSLVFDFETGRYDVIQVSKLDYKLCTVWNPTKIFYGGPAIVPLTEPGVFYFVCNFSNYCDLGMRLSVTVHDSCSARKPDPPSPSPSPAIYNNATPPTQKSPVPVPILAPAAAEKSAATTAATTMMMRRSIYNIFGLFFIVLF